MISILNYLSTTEISISAFSFVLIHAHLPSVQTLRRLEQQQLTRRRQLSEEQRTFAFIMTKRLGQRGARPQTAPSYTTTTSAFSAVPLRGSQSAPAALATHTTGSDSLGSAKGANSRETKFKVEKSSNLSTKGLKEYWEDNRETRQGEHNCEWSRLQI